MSAAKLRWWLLFLAFREPDPKHTVIEGLTVAHLVAVCLSTVFLASAVFIYVLPALGLIGACVSVVLADVLLLELLHIMYDR